MIGAFILLVLLMLVSCLNAQDANNSNTSSTTETALKSVAYATQATSEIRGIMRDPTSFTLLRVIAITKEEKDGRTNFRGCVHYMGSNSFGDRLQRWGRYFVNKKGELKSWPGTQFSSCIINKKDVQSDVTDEVEKHLLSRR